MDFTKRMKPESVLIVDAGALNLFRNIQHDNILYTPHLGEFSAMTGKKYSHIFHAIDDLKNFCIQNNTAVLLKDSACILCKKDGTLFIYSRANENIGVMGSGDVLCGFLALSLKASNMEKAVYSALSWLK